MRASRGQKPTCVAGWGWKPVEAKAAKVNRTGCQRGERCTHFRDLQRVILNTLHVVRGVGSAHAFEETLRQGKEPIKLIRTVHRIYRGLRIVPTAKTGNFIIQVALTLIRVGRRALPK